MNIEWAIEELDKFIEQTVMRNGSGSHGGIAVFTSQNYTAASDADVARQAQVIEKILDRVIPDWLTAIENSKSNRWTRHREAAIRAREELVRDEEIRQNLGDNAPELSAARLHTWVWDGARSLWQSGHYREAVGGAIRKLNAETQNKVGRRDISETDLFKQTFSLEDPKPAKARLRRMENDGSDTYKSVQRGAMSLAEGIFAGIRNPLSHEVDQELSEQEALEYLAALSVLARWVDEAEVEAGS
ncbi:restriction endonuclease (plasmid) [Rhodococcus sp. p52]|uniref:TIGR02391 family protein n=1 Tax=unclassified Rhodococcus (in: high G+C Gram-positive bacteria) TaxID=192944 RepID=UPI00051A35AA|nr:MULTISPECIES: TIGR02391 family protein [unclassified Rhodococcus (in: high G+C Gram-positive bacteria)]AOD24961.1 restriction endonuclease [Rhodococcus sp. p52]MCT7294088.1 TIGR02391 family protein [Rhodococcus sp. PAE-6]